VIHAFFYQINTDVHNQPSKLLYLIVTHQRKLTSKEA
jgi:hypothetical protein